MVGHRLPPRASSPGTAPEQPSDSLSVNPALVHQAVDIAGFLLYPGIR